MNQLRLQQIEKFAQNHVAGKEGRQQGEKVEWMEFGARKRGLYPIVVFYCYKANYHKPRGLKQHTLITSQWGGDWERLIKVLCFAVSPKAAIKMLTRAGVSPECCKGLAFKPMWLLASVVTLRPQFLALLCHMSLYNMASWLFKGNKGESMLAGWTLM